MNTHEFFAISKEKGKIENKYELNNLGDQRILFMSANQVRDDWGYSRRYDYNTSYTNTSSVDYDNCMAAKLNDFNPVYNLHEVLDFHLEYYLYEKDGDKDLFIRHIKYEIIPILKKGSYSRKEECLELINEWIISLSEGSNNIWLYAGVLITGVIAYDQYQKNKKLQKKIINNQYLGSLKKELEKEHKLSISVLSQLNYIINTYQGIDIKVVDELKCILDLIGQSKASESIFKLTKVIENLLKNRFVSEGIYSSPKNCPSLHNMIKEAVSLNWISNREAKFIDILREPRNQEAHELAVVFNENEFYIYLFAGFEIMYSLIGIKYPNQPVLVRTHIAPLTN